MYTAHALYFNRLFDTDDLALIDFAWIYGAIDFMHIILV